MKKIFLNVFTFLSLGVLCLFMNNVYASTNISKETLSSNSCKSPTVSVPSAANTYSLVQAGRYFLAPNSEGVSLVNEVEIGSSNSTGLLNISIPIGELPNKELTFGLNYSGVILADRLPGNAGLGWRADLGGLITRVVVGLPDEYNSATQKGFWNLSQAERDIFKLQPSALNIPANKAFFDNLANRGIDCGLDVFYYDIAGYKGRFVVTADKRVVTFPRTNLDIRPAFTTTSTGSVIESFVCVTPNGIRFIVNMPESAKANFWGSSISYSVSWKVTSIEKSNQQLVKFTYNRYQASRYRKTTDFNLDNNYVGTDSTLVDEFLMKLSSINSRGCNTYFTYDSNNRLTQIVMSESGAAEDLNKKIELSYAGDLLKSITNKIASLTSTNGEEEIYSFSYYNEAGTLAYARSNQDWSGFRNGLTSNQSILPSIYRNGGLASFTADPGYTLLYSGASKQPNLDRAIDGVLKSITNSKSAVKTYSYQLADSQYGGYIVSKEENKDLITGSIDSVNYTYSNLLNNPISANKHNINRVWCTSINGESFLRIGYWPQGILGFGTTLPAFGKVTAVGNRGKVETVSALAGLGGGPAIPTAYDWLKTASQSAEVLLSNSDYTEYYVRGNGISPTLSSPLVISTTDKQLDDQLQSNVSTSYDVVDVKEYIGELFPIARVNVYNGTALVGSKILLDHSYWLSAWVDVVGNEKVSYPLGVTSEPTSNVTSYAYSKNFDNRDIRLLTYTRETNSRAGQKSYDLIKYARYSNDDAYRVNTTSTQTAYDSFKNCLNQVYTSNTNGFDPGNVVDTTCTYQVGSNLANLQPAVAAIMSMRGQGNFVTPIEEYQVVANGGVGYVTSANLYTYNIRPNNSVLLKSMSSIDSPILLSSFTPSFFQNDYLISNSSYTLNFENSKWDASDNTIEMINGKTGVTNSYLYDSNRDFIIAEGYNMGIDSLSRVYSGLSKLKPGTQIVKYKYIKPFGMVSKTDSRGQSEYYLYSYKLGSPIGIRDNEYNLRSVNLTSTPAGQLSYQIASSTDPLQNGSIRNDESTFNLSCTSPSFSSDYYTEKDFTFSTQYCYGLTYEYDFGDSTSIKGGNSEVSHHYYTAGLNTVKLKIYNGNYLLKSNSLQLNVKRNAPAVDLLFTSVQFGVTSTSTSCPTNVESLQISITPKGGTGKFLVDYAVNGVSDGSIVHIYNTVGSYNVACNVYERTNDTGAKQLLKSYNWTFKVVASKPKPGDN